MRSRILDQKILADSLDLLCGPEYVRKVSKRTNPLTSEPDMDLTASQIAFNQTKVATEIKTLRAEITDRAEMIATLAQNGGFTIAEKAKTAAVSGRAALDVQIAAWRTAFDAEIAAATAEQIADAKALCVENDISTAWF